MQTIQKIFRKTVKKYSTSKQPHIYKGTQTQATTANLCKRVLLADASKDTSTQLKQRRDEPGEHTTSALAIAGLTEILSAFCLLLGGGSG